MMMIFVKITVQCVCMMMVLVMDIGDAATAKQVDSLPPGWTR